MLDRDIQSTIDQIREVVLTSPVQQAVAKLLPAVKEEIQDALERMNRKTAYVAAIGPQGCGKSSLLNSLLFSRRVLPIGQGVTTNAICYVEDAGESEERTEVTLTTGKMEGPLGYEFLRDFMDETQNPENRKGVSEIHCFARAAFLANHTAFVDTPGLGSTKAWHDKKTFAFAKDMALGICVIRSEELKGSEIEFLKIIWPLSPRYIFVQNVWGEPPEQVEARLVDNRRRLQEIATEFGDMNPVLVLPVNIHQGLEGATNNRPELIESSGLAKLKDAVATQTDRGGQRLEVKGQGERIVGVLRRGAISANRQINALASEKDSEALKAEHKQARAKLKKLQAEANEAGEDFRTRHATCLQSFRKRLEREMDQVWREYRQRVQAGKVDDYFTSDFQSALKGCIAGEVETLQRDLGDIEADYVRGAMKRAEAAFNVSVPAGLKQMDGTGSRVMEWTGDVVAGVGTIGLTSLGVATISTIIATVSTGGTASAGLMIALATIPGAGWVIAGGLVAAGAAISYFSRESWKGKLLEEIERVAKRTCTQAIESVSAECTERRDSLIAVVDGHFRGVVAQQQREIAEIEAKLTLNKEDREREISDLNQKKADMESAITQIESLLQFEPVGRVASQGFAAGTSTGPA
jgi:hypothetical protein